MQIPNLNALAKEIHVDNLYAGWWDPYLPDKKSDRVPTDLMLTVTEFAEACEGDRKSLNDDHLPHYPMMHVEIADAMIRLLDLAGAMGVDLSSLEDLSEDPTAQAEVEEWADGSVPEQLLVCVAAVTQQDTSEHDLIGMGVGSCLMMAMIHKFDLFEIVAEKRAYNAQRADHRRENRAKAGGKAY